MSDVRSKVLLGLGKAFLFSPQKFLQPPCLRDESSGLQEPDTGAGESGELGRDTAGGGWASAGLSRKAEAKFLMYLTRRDSPELQWHAGSGVEGIRIREPVVWGLTDLGLDGQ